MHKPLPVLRADLAEGAVAGEGDGVVFAAPPLRKRDIPTPIIATVSRYEEEQTGSFSVPDGYIRFPRRTAGEDDVAACQYSLEVEDEEWLNRHPRYGLAGAPSEQGKINEDDLEEMMGILERATGTADCVPLSQAETLFVSKLGMSKAEHHHAWSEVYKYWKDKRGKLGKPLLRRFWPMTSPNDTDPHKVFRPREKERYKLRKHRKNDLESFRKLQQVKKDFEKLLRITKMIEEREMMKREQLMVQQEIFLQQHWDLTDTTGEARPLGVTPGLYGSRHRLSAPPESGVEGGATGTVLVGQKVEAPIVPIGSTPVVSEPPIEQPEGRDRKNRKRKKDDRYRSSPRDVGGQIEGDARDHGDRYSGGGAGSGSGTAGVSGGIAPGVIPGSHISVLPSFMDELKTRARMPVRTVVEPALAVYSVNGGEDVPGKDRGRSGTRGARGPGRRKPRVGVEPVYKFRLRGRIGRGGRVMWDRVPVKGAQPLRDDGLADPEEAPLVVHSTYVQFPFKPPSAHTLHPPMVNLNADDRRYREICAMDDDQEELLEPLGLGLMPDPSSPSVGAADPSAGGSGGDPISGGGRVSGPKIKYAIEV